MARFEYSELVQELKLTPAEYSLRFTVYENSPKETRVSAQAPQFIYELGNDGWELVCYCESMTEGVRQIKRWFFKREKGK